MLQFRLFRGILPPLVPVVAAALGSPAPHVIFVLPEIRTVPVDRLVASLEAQIQRDRNGVELHLNLAGLHTMAHALETSDAQLARFGSKEEVW